MKAKSLTAITLQTVHWPFFLVPMGASIVFARLLGLEAHRDGIRIYK